MNNLFSGKFSSSDVEMATPSSGGANLDKFFEDAETIKDDLKDIDELLKNLKHNHEESKTVHNSKSVKDLRSKMDRDVSLSLKKAKLIKVRLEALDRGNAANRSVAGCEAGSSADRTRTSVVGGLRNKLKGKMDEFQELRDRINAEYRETIERRYFTVTGVHADEQTVDQLISTGESETFLQKAIQDQGRGKILDTITEIQERHDAVRDMERNLRELHEVFMDMAVLVEQQGEHMNDIEAQVHRANSFVKRGTEELQTAKKLQKNSRKWVCIGIIILLIIILILLVALHPWTKKWSL